MFKFMHRKGGHHSTDRLKLQRQLFDFRRTAHHGFPNKPSAMAWDPDLRLLAIATKSGALKVKGYLVFEASSYPSAGQPYGVSQCIDFFLADGVELIASDEWDWAATLTRASGVVVQSIEFRGFLLQIAALICLQAGSPCLGRALSLPYSFDLWRLSSPSSAEGTSDLCSLWRLSSPSSAEGTSDLCSLWRLSSPSSAEGTSDLCSLWRLSSPSSAEGTSDLCSLWRLSSPRVRLGKEKVLLLSFRCAFNDWFAFELTVIFRGNCSPCQSGEVLSSMSLESMSVAINLVEGGVVADIFRVQSPSGSSKYWMENSGFFIKALTTYLPIAIRLLP
ncbi:unnamed protein product [Cyprideis torosa]|uniref:Uncharacterized protein n=1 Tax=Cyprideis torosa TaxID=163714 RepID=A0A7R8WGU6_9CRUS|nr:unnamed protein product [Cyprideis torosa]CAG0898627.1 unnamed protein product [Cyprideis torosa]